VSVPGTPPGCERVAYVLGRREKSGFSDTYGGGGDIIGLDCHLVRPVDRPSDTVVIFMHPTGGGMYLPIVGGMAMAGHHVIWANSRYRGADFALIMEKVAADLGATVADARDRLGYDKVVLAGWSGGGSLSTWYQSLAEAGNGISDTAAGDPYEVAASGLPAADALLVMAAHISRHGTLTEWMDASIHDESAPHVRDVELNIYDPANPNQPTYSSDFLETYRAAQVTRNRRITADVRQRLEDLRVAGRENEEFAFTVHGTMADPRWLDPTVDPSDRQPNWCYLGDPRIVNDGPADDACPPSHTHRIFDAIGHDRKRLHEVQGATHYYSGENGRQHMAEAISVVGDFLAENL